MATAAAAAAVAAAHTPTAAAAVTPPPPPAVPPGFPLFPLALQPVLTPAVRAREAPFLFRATAAIFAAWWDCLGPYVDAAGGGSGLGHRSGNKGGGEAAGGGKGRR